jgi:predicted GH43/DUF377 family glycosyl hydrolase
MLQDWKKHKLIFRPSGELAWMRTHAQLPTPFWTSDRKLRIYFGTRDANNRTSTVFLEVDPESPTEVLRVHDVPVLPLGALGCFDDVGVMPGSLVAIESKTYFYYTGWNTSTTVPYRLSIGLAISDDGGLTFHRPFEGPILDRTPREPYFCNSPCVLFDGGIWRMWYNSATEWLVVRGRPEPRYLFRYAESNDGFEWRRSSEIAVGYTSPDEAIARPWVVKDESGYRMWFSARSVRDYRSVQQQSYRMGYAESTDGISWQRKDECVQLPLSTTGWDSEMIAYPTVFDVENRRYVLYNGNGFGASGFGIAELRNVA